MKLTKAQRKVLEMFSDGENRVVVESNTHRSLRKRGLITCARVPQRGVYRDVITAAGRDALKGDE